VHASSKRIEALIAERHGDLAAAGQAAAQRDREVAGEQRQMLLRQLEAERMAARAELKQAIADRQRLESALQDVESQHQHLAASHAAERSCLQQLQQELASEYRRELRAREQEVAGRVAAEQAQLERAASTEAERNRLAKAAADQEVALHASADHTRRLAPLAAAGRAALDVGAQLRDLAQEVDNRATRILAGCPLDAPERADLQLLRARAICVAALTRELFDTGTELTDCRQTVSPIRVSRSTRRR
jgi:hypothetical protein